LLGLYLQKSGLVQKDLVQRLLRLQVGNLTGIYLNFLLNPVELARDQFKFLIDQNRLLVEIWILPIGLLRAVSTFFLLFLLGKIFHLRVSILLQSLLTYEYQILLCLFLHELTIDRLVPALEFAQQFRVSKLILLVALDSVIQF